MSTIEKLQKLLNTYKILLKKQQNGEIKCEGLPTHKYGLSDYFFREMIKIFDFNEKPIVLRNDNYERIPSKTYYHGFARYEYGKSFLNDDEYWSGTGSYSNGFFVTENFDESKQYTLENYDDKPDGGRVLSLKCLYLNAIHIHHIYLIRNYILDGIVEGMPEKYASKVRVLFKFLESIKDESLRDGFLNLMLIESELATFLGYDIIEPYENNTSILLNRGKIVVSEETSKLFEEGASEEMSELLK